VDAGADMIFPEALADESEFEKMRAAVKVPLLANMTEFGKTKLLDATALEKLGYNVVIYPVTALRLAMKAIEDGYVEMKRAGNNAAIVDRMMTRKRLYELLRYEDYAAFDKDVFNFRVN
jgi:methylisocitrate lyase